VDLITIDSLADADIAAFLDKSQVLFEDVRKGSVDRTLSGRILFNLFYENSTRTMMSFATAAHRLGMDVVTLPVEQSSVKKGETLSDTARTLGAMRPDALVIRHPDNGAAELVAAIMEDPFINAGDGTNEHPTQALLDAATLTRHFGSLDGKTIAICGDIKHSRVARSNAKLLPRLGATVRLAGPAKLMPADAPPLTVDEAIADADAVMMLRVQRERLEEELGDTPGEYLRLYGLTLERLAKAAPGAVVLHPGPMNRGVEITDAIADDPERSLIATQVEMGVATRMACLEILVGGGAA
jgi:aspartate carbamoyltransferase catalytic subunit